MKLLKIFNFLYKIFLFSFLSIIIIIIGLYSYAYLQKPLTLNSFHTYELYDINNNIFYEGTNTNRWTKIDKISNNLKNAVISVEDKNFYEHNGFDYLRILKAFFTNFKSRKIVEGGSTISQQYIKNAYLDFDKTWSRKVKEAMMTLNLEMHYTKDEILEAYLNTINYGLGNYGIVSAANFYFNKNVDELTLEESIILAGIPKNPSNYNPVSNYDKSIQRAKVVALTMLNNGYISSDEYNNLFKNKIEIYGKKNNNNLQMISYYEDAVYNELKSISGISEKDINSGNLKIFTTLNINYQKKLEEEILNNITDEKLQVASVIVDPETGGIFALTGGINYNKSQYNRALSSKRQVGSTMKPFLYYSALNNGMTSSSTFLSQYTTFTLSQGKTYSPKNFANLYGNKEITMAAAIAYSDNIYAVKTNLFLGIDKLVDTAKKCGIKEKLNEVTSLALGTSELNLIDFATGYNTFASGGYKRSLYFINKIEDKEGKIIYEHQKENNLVLNPNYVYILNEMLTSTTNSAFVDYNTPTGLNIASKLKQKYAFKTGTTDSDYWAVGYNKDILMLMWSGYDNNSNIDLKLGNEVKNTWANVVSYIQENDQDSWYQMPTNVVGMPLNAISGKPSLNNKNITIFYYLKGSEPEYNNLEYKKKED